MSLDLIQIGYLEISEMAFSMEETPGFEAKASLIISQVLRPLRGLHENHLAKELGTASGRSTFFPVCSAFFSDEENKMQVGDGQAFEVT